MVGAADLMQATGHGRLILLTGLSGAGKTTLGYLLVKHLTEFGSRPAYFLDGDVAREFFGNDVGYSLAERDAAARRMAFGAHLLVRQNIDVVMANIAGSKQTRDFFRRRFVDYVEVYLDVHVDVLKTKDVKGVYRRALALETPELVGVDLPFEVPEAPHVVVRPHEEPPEHSLQRIIAFLVQHGPTIGTKADTLQSLAGHLRRARVLPQLALTWSTYQRNPQHLFEIARDRLGAASVAVRSSCSAEDGSSGSNAGCFTSLLSVPLEAGAIGAALQRVRDDYAAKNVPGPDDAQILVQPMLEGVQMSGVVFTRHEYADSPYYVINFDDASGMTDTVTGGKCGRTVFISRFIEGRKLGRWSGLIAAVRELEALFPSFPLDIEFAQLAHEEIVVLQCRRLAVHGAARSLEQSAGEMLHELKLRFERCQQPYPPLVGARTLLSDMADWNPAEMLGEKPNTLAHSIYREIITDQVWHRARASQGYFDVRSVPLMLSIGRKSYIDTRASFNSLTPANLPSDLRRRLVEFYLDKLARHPELHDKVEFEIVYTCYDLTVPERIREAGTLSSDEQTQVVTALRELTNRLICDGLTAIEHDLAQLELLQQYAAEIQTRYAGATQFWELFHAAHLLLDQTKPLGTLPFARLARLGFIAKSLLRSLEETGLVPSELASRFLAAVPTVASRYRTDLQRLQSGALAAAEFMARYGHLRMNTYNIVAPRYDQLPPSTFATSASIEAGPASDGTIPAEVLRGVDRALAQHFLECDAQTLFRFIAAATQAREEGKFRFTRAVSDALECIARAGQALDISREELQYLSLATLLRFRNPEFSAPARAAAYLRSRIGEKEHERSVYDVIKLPAVLATTDDIDLVPVFPSHPNFVTRKRVIAPVVWVRHDIDPASIDLTGKIAAIENADPGYDWIFAARIAGLVTKYGGAASHMAIRCFEFDLPGAIGCGEAIFSALEGANLLLLDCGERVISRV